MKIEKSITHDFPGGISLVQLRDVFLASYLGVKLYDVNSIGDTLNIVFNSNISNADIEFIDTMIDNYVFDPYYEIRSDVDLVIAPETNSTNLSSWITLKSFIFPGVSKVGYPSSIEVIGYVDEGEEGYIRLYSEESAETIAEVLDFKNAKPEIKSLGRGTHWPINRAICDIQAKVCHCGTNKKSVYVSEVRIAF